MKRDVTACRCGFKVGPAHAWTEACYLPDYLAPMRAWIREEVRAAMHTHKENFHTEDKRPRSFRALELCIAHDALDLYRDHNAISRCYCRGCDDIVALVAYAKVPERDAR